MSVNWEEIANIVRKGDFYTGVYVNPKTGEVGDIDNFPVDGVNTDSLMWEENTAKGVYHGEEIVHVFETYEFLDSGRHFEYWLGSLAEDGEPFAIGYATVDSWEQDEDDEEEFEPVAVGWALIVKVLK